MQPQTESGLEKRPQLVPKLVERKRQGISEGMSHLDESELQPSSLSKDDVERRKINEKDKVAFLLYRAPVSSWPSEKLRNLEDSQPEELTRMLPMHRTQFCWANHDEVERDVRFVRKRDRMTEYTEIKMLQAHILRKG
jgi:hypothetical protein